MSAGVRWVPDPAAGWELAAAGARALAAADRVVADAERLPGWEEGPVEPAPADGPAAVAERLAALAQAGLAVVRLVADYATARVEAALVAARGLAVELLPAVGLREQALAAGLAGERGDWRWADGSSGWGVAWEQPAADVGRWLVGHGVAPDRPVTVITHPGRGDQGWRRGSAASFVGVAVPAGSVAWVGETDAHWDWRGARPLAGRRVLTVGEAGGREAWAALEEAGAVVVPAPSIRLQPVPAEAAVQAAVAQAESYDVALFTSRAAVTAWFAAMRLAGRDVRSLRAAVAAVGAATAQALWAYGIRARWTPPPGRESQEGLWEVLAGEPWAGRRVLWPGGTLNAPFLKEALNQRGAVVQTLVVYRNLPQTLPPAVRRALAAGGFDLLLFTAPSTVERLAEQLEEAELAAARRIPAGAIGGKTRHALESRGFAVVVRPAAATVAELAQAARDYLLQAAPGR